MKSRGTRNDGDQTVQTLSIKLPDSVNLPKDLIQDLLQYLLVGLLRSKGLIDDEDVVELTGTSVREFETRLAEYEDLRIPPRVKDETSESRWAALANRYRERPCLSGKSETLNELIREFRDEFTL